MKEVFKLFGKIEINKRDIERDLRDVERKTEKTSRGIERNFSKLKGRVKSIFRGLGSVAKGVAVGLSGVGISAVKMATDFNSAMANVSTLLGRGSRDINEYKKDVQRLAIETGKSTRDLADGLYQVISAFGETKDTMYQLKLASKMAIAGLSSTTEAINLLSSVSKGYGDTSKEMLQKISDLAFMTVKLGQTTFPELASSMGRVIPIAKSMGVKIEEVFGIMSTFTGVTGSASEVVTQFRGVLQALMSPTKDMADLLHKYGYESGRALIKAKGLAGAIKWIVERAKESGVPLQKFIGQIEGQTLALSLAGAQSDTYNEKLGKLVNEGIGATNEAFEKQTKGINTLGTQWHRLQQIFVVFMQNLGDKIAPVLLDFVEKDLKPLMENTDTLNELLKGLATAFIVVAKAINGTVGFVKTISRKLGGLSVEIENYYQKVKEKLPEAWEYAKRQILRELGIVSKKEKELEEKNRKILQNIDLRTGKEIKQWVGHLEVPMTTMIKLAKQGHKLTFSLSKEGWKMVNEAKKYLRNMVSGYEWLWKSNEQAKKKIQGNNRELLIEFKEGVNEAKKYIWNIVGEYEWLWKSSETTTRRINDNTRDLRDTAGGYLYDLGRKFYSTALNIAGSYKWIEDGSNWLTSTLDNNYKQLMSSISSVWGVFRGYANDVVNNYGWVADIFSGTTEDIEQSTQQQSYALESLRGHLNRTIYDMLSGATKVKGVWGGLKSFFGSLVDWFKKYVFQQIAQGLTNAFLGMLTGRGSNGINLSNIFQLSGINRGGGSNVLGSILGGISRVFGGGTLGGVLGGLGLGAIIKNGGSIIRGVVNVGKNIISGIGRGISGVARGIKKFFGHIFHKGGIVGRSGSGRYIPADIFANAPRFHNGAYLKPDEVPAILQKGELVIPKNLVGAIGKGVANITIMLDGKILAQKLGARLVDEIKIRAGVR